MIFARFDADIAKVRDESHRERSLKDKAIREKDLCVTERLQLEAELEVGRNTVIPYQNANFSRWTVY